VVIAASAAADVVALAAGRVGEVSVALLKTKLYISPPRPNLVLRPRLIQRLDDGLRLGSRLTLVSAPAGYGKSTLVTSWLQGVDLQSTWLSLDEGDNEPLHFLTYFVAALQEIDGAIGQAVQGQLRAPKPPPIESLVVELINDISVTPNQFVLVLDDYHTIAELAVHEAIQFLLDRQPPQMHLVITTRLDPPLPLSRLRARGQLTEIRQHDLRFDYEETASFLNRCLGLDLAETEIAELEERTEGWIAGLQLAGLSMQGRDRKSITQFVEGFSGKHHFILDYLADEVLERQPEAVQMFLLQTSILERMCGPLCDAVVATGDRGQQPSQEVLQAFERANLFIIPLDDERRWYRYHHLFAELLQARLQESQSDSVPDLHRRAVAWYEENKFASEAVHHALASKDFVVAAAVVERAILKIATWSSTDVATLLGWMRALPDGVVHARPWLQIFLSRALYATGQKEPAERVLQKLEDALQADPSTPDAERVLWLAVADRAGYAAVRGDVRQTLDFAQRALANMPKDDAIAHMRALSLLGLAKFRAGNVAEAYDAFSRTIAIAIETGNNFVAAPIACNLAETLMAQGQLHKALEACEQAREMGTYDGSLIPAAGFVGLERGKILYEQNDLEAAEGDLVEGLELLSRGGIAENFGTGHALLARIQQAKGDSAAALVMTQKAVETAHQGGIQRLAVLASAYQARIWLAQGDLEQAARWAVGYRGSGDTEYLRVFEDLTLARVLLADGQSAEALELLRNLLSLAKADGRMGHVLEILTLQALVRATAGDTTGALQDLERALALGEPEGYVRVFVDEGEPMAALLRQAALRGITPQYVRKLLAALAPERGALDEEPPPPQPLVEPLTERELEVLHLLAERLTNPEIAQRLFISLPTVKSHTSSIYGKLGVHDRRKAVTQARALGILPHR
jgi:LuxR family maltose regulon positive regulatory protein